jgi:hypothetical protein
VAKDLAHLGVYSDWAEVAKHQTELYPVAAPGEATRRRIRDVLGFAELPPIAGKARVEVTWERDGLAGEEISWSVGYGPKTRAWILKPAGADRPLAGVVALHGHDRLKFLRQGEDSRWEGPLSCCRGKYPDGPLRGPSFCQ